MCQIRNITITHALRNNKTPTHKKKKQTSTISFFWCALWHPTIGSIPFSGSTFWLLGQLAVAKAARKTSESTTGGAFTVARHRLNRSTWRLWNLGMSRLGTEVVRNGSMGKLGWINGFIENLLYLINWDETTH